jgi:hypothetical protein
MQRFGEKTRHAALIGHPEVEGAGPEELASFLELPPIEEVLPQLLFAGRRSTIDPPFPAARDPPPRAIDMAAARRGDRRCLPG